MKAISLHQPWATWVCLKWKTIETRTHERFKSLKGQQIAIHAAQKIDEAAFLNEYLPHYLRPHHHRILDINNMIMFVKMNRGKIICTAKIVDARWAPNVDFDMREDWDKQALCEVAGNYCLFLGEIRTLKHPVPWKGRQGIFNVPEEVIRDACD